ncbi:hypothetical protein BU25DRAFT_442690 [Macroventuria anomochaeta]|uniref:Uncharacterized protein n=1 Tax=Macroventuria anomochaeta TaxID=301207 RepID=A0ACB6RQ67_9PLEO|nr:uncharacterized protein BU25DRAFT_442690 [Macroventuria anomochaeta]KAF2623273.1 hypothetical protein BU25DRAFT_442690 [Macroventuria anomochaeta]
MPIFHDPQDSPPRRTASRQMSSDEAPKEGMTNFNEDASPLGSLSLESMMGSGTAHEPVSHGSRPTSRDRNGLMERIKRVKSPLWHRHDRNLQSSRPSSRDRPKTPSGPTSDLQVPCTASPDQETDHASAGLEIARPRSALHSGDFREREGGADTGNVSSSAFLPTSPVAPWKRSFPAAAIPQSRGAAQYAFNNALSYDPPPVSRARAISKSPSTSFTFMPPTSPLVQQLNNTDLDFTSRSSTRRRSRSPDRSNRRHTFSPDSFEQYQTTQTARSASGTPAARHLRRGGTIPYQAHQPRRSVTSLSQFEPHSSPQTPFAARRPSISDASPLQHAPMVGSYEESILRGRMSTTPSRPLDFVAKIGVLGRGQCKSSLKCPPHVTVPFPAVFYSYNTGNGRISDNEPSPYVGLIDLEHSLPPPVDSHEPSKRKQRQAAPVPDQDNLDFRLQFDDEHTGEGGSADLRRKEKRKRRSASPKAPPGGCYRIPAEGQLQIVLKNPNRTAVKLFLVPYDVSDMEPGQKTFIRQRSYSAGPIIDMPLSSRKNFGTDRPEAALSNSDDPRDRPILRYLVHLHICCTGKGRYYLYKSIRVVFANRVPDGKEKLRNEIQQPEPKYSTYKPSRDSTTAQAASSPGALSITAKARRRQSAAWPLSCSQQMYDQMDGLSQNPQLPPPAVRFTGGPLSSSASGDYGSSIPLVQPIPFNLTRLAAIESRPVSRERMGVDPKSPFRSPLASPSPGLGNSIIHQEATFEKLNRGDVGYGGNAFSPLGSPASPPAAGLLAQRLRGLEVQPDEEVD